MRERGLREWDQVPPGSQPAMFLHQGPQRATRRRQEGVTTWEWYAMLAVYFRLDTLRNGSDFEIINELLDSIEAVFIGRIPGEQQTLGGTIYDCYIDGEIGVYEGDSDPNQGVVLCPLVLLTGV